MNSIVVFRVRVKFEFKKFYFSSSSSAKTIEFKRVRSPDYDIKKIDYEEKTRRKNREPKAEVGM